MTSSMKLLKGVRGSLKFGEHWGWCWMTSWSSIHWGRQQRLLRLSSSQRLKSTSSSGREGGERGDGNGEREGDGKVDARPIRITRLVRSHSTDVLMPKGSSMARESGIWGNYSKFERERERRNAMAKEGLFGVFCAGGLLDRCESPLTVCGTAIYQGLSRPMLGLDPRLLHGTAAPLVQ